MPSNYTTNYQLNQWEAGDKVERVDFNADNAKIDAAVKAVDQAREALGNTVAALQTTVARKQDAASAVKFVTGSYTGDGAASRTIPLGFTPKAVFVISQKGYTYSTSAFHGGLALTGCPVASGNYKILTIVNGGFEVYYSRDTTWTVYTNASGVVLYYIAFA